MWRKYVLLLFLSVLTALPIAARADDATTVYTLSGRCSIDLPAGWVVDQEPTAQFPGENLIAASSAAVLDAYRNHQSIDGSIVVIDFSPVDIFRTYTSMDAAFQFDLEGKTGDDLLEALTIRGVPMQIDGYPARRYRERGGGIFAGVAHFGETNVLVGRLLYRITYTSPDMANAEAIVDTLKVYTDAVAGIERPPLVLEDVSLDLEPSWLPIRWYFGVPLGRTRITMGSTSMGYYYAILVEKLDDFLPLLYSPQDIGMGSASPVDLPGLYVMIGVHPYDQMFDSADIPVNQSHREIAFSKIMNAASAAAEGEPQLAVIEAAPALTAPLDQVFGRPNRGQLTVIDANYIFYSILIAAPADEWDQARADAILARLHVTPTAPLTAGEIGSGAQVGLYAPDFTLSLVDGRRVSLSDYRGKVVLLNFWATWCSPCVAEMDDFQQYYADHSADTVILAVDFSEPAEVVASFVEENGLTYPVALDLDGVVNQLYRVQGYPTTCLIDAEGIIHSISLSNADSVYDVERLIRDAAE